MGTLRGGENGGAHPPAVNAMHLPTGQFLPLGVATLDSAPSSADGTLFPECLHAVNDVRLEEVGGICSSQRLGPVRTIL